MSAHMPPDACVWCQQPIIVKRTATRDLEVYVFRKTRDGRIQLHERCAPKWDQEVRLTAEHA